jgi:hypothetical protein
MAERDPQFEQDVRRIVYEALADREALAAAMAGQQPTPVPDPTPEEPATPASRRPGPSEVGVQGGADPQRVPPLKAHYCPKAVFAHPTDVWYSDDPDPDPDTGAEKEFKSIMQKTGATREQVIQELMRRSFMDKINELDGDIPPPGD